MMSLRLAHITYLLPLLTALTTAIPSLTVQTSDINVNVKNLDCTHITPTTSIYVYTHCVYIFMNSQPAQPTPTATAAPSNGAAAGAEPRHVAALIRDAGRRGGICFVGD
jgi:hypothetical protein